MGVSEIGIVFSDLSIIHSCHIRENHTEIKRKNFMSSALPRPVKVLSYYYLPIKHLLQESYLTSNIVIVPFHTQVMNIGA